MLEPLVEGAGCLVALALLAYYQVWRPSREAARERAKVQADADARSSQSGGGPAATE